MSDIRLRVLSLGAGVQSTTLALMAAHGEIGPMPDCAIFADTQAEPAAVYSHLSWLMAPDILPFPVHIVTAGSLWQSATTVRRTRDGERDYIKTALPVYLLEGLSRGQGLRHCTRDFKIVPVNRKLRELLGRRAIKKTDGVLVELWMGISQDEEHRRKPNPLSWITARFPLLELGLRRGDCLRWIAKHGYPEPPRSACTFCAFREDAEWMNLPPAEFANAVTKERELQAAYAATSEMRGVPFFHADRVPLDKVKMTPSLFRDQFGNECSGFCGG